MLDTSDGAMSTSVNILRMEARDGDEMSRTLLHLIDEGIVEIQGFDWETGQAHFDLTGYGHELGPDLAHFLEDHHIESVAEAYQAEFGCIDPYNPNCDCDGCKAAEEDYESYGEF